MQAACGTKKTGCGIIGNIHAKRHCQLRNHCQVYASQLVNYIYRSLF